MSLSLGDDRRDRDGQEITQAWGEFRANDPYAPDLEAYSGPIGNDGRPYCSPHDQLRAALQSSAPPSMTISAIAADGLRENVRLNGAQTRAYLESSLVVREGIRRTKIREQRWVTAREAARKVAAGEKLIEQLHPYEEACLRQFGMIEDVEARVPLDEGGYALREAATLREGATQRLLREDPGVFGSATYGDDQSPTSQGYLDQEYLNYGGPMGQQLQLNDVWEQSARCFWAWHHDPVAQEGCNIIRNFVVGRGVTVQAKDDRVQAVIDKFDERNAMVERLKVWTVSLSRDGELFIRKIKSGDGTIIVRSLSTDTIWDLVTDADDIEKVYYYVQRYMSRTQLFSPPNGDSQEWIERWLTPDECIHVKINVAESEVRGRSNLFVVLGHLKRLRDLFDTLVMKEQAQAAYQYDIEVDGSPAEVTTYANTALPKGKPQPGSSYVHNKAVVIKTLTSGKSSGTGQGSAWEGLLTMVAIGLGIAKDYLGVTSRGSRSTALVATEPTAIRIEERQDTISSLLKRLYQDEIKEADTYGLLAGVEDFSFQIICPEIQKDDSGERIDAINVGRSMGYVSHRTAATQYASEMDLDDYDYDAEQMKIAQEYEEAVAAGRVQLILAKYAAIPMGDASSGTVGADPSEAPGGQSPGQSGQQPQGKSTKSPTSKTGAAAIRRDLGRNAREGSSVAERWVGSYA